MIAGSRPAATAESLTWTQGMPMSESNDRTGKDLQELAAWLERCRNHVDFLRDRIGNDFPTDMIEGSVPPSFAFHADSTLASVAEDIEEIMTRLRKAARKTGAELHASWSWDQKDAGKTSGPKR